MSVVRKSPMAVTAFDPVARWRARAWALVAYLAVLAAVAGIVLFAVRYQPLSAANFASGPVAQSDPHMVLVGYANGGTLSFGFLIVNDGQLPVRIQRIQITGQRHLLVELGFGVYATAGTGDFLKERGIPVVILQKIGAGARPNVIDMMQDGKIQLVINTPTKTGWQTDEGRIRAATVRLGVPMITTTTGALAAARAIGAMRHGDWSVKAMQDYQRDASKANVSG